MNKNDIQGDRLTERPDQKNAELMENLPVIIAGPLLRHVDCREINLWLTTSAPCSWAFSLYDHNHSLIQTTHISCSEAPPVQVGSRCFISLIHVPLEQPMQAVRWYFYDLVRISDAVSNSDAPVQAQSLAALVPSIVYEAQTMPGFYFNPDVNSVFHGSCRKPHQAGDDGLLVLDNHIGRALSSRESSASLVLFSGDQVYVDDVAGPMLTAIHQVADILGLFDEAWTGAEVNTSQQLRASPHGYYGRDKLLPDHDDNQPLYKTFFRGTKKPIFTSVGAQNHLITLSEVVAMYLLVWSDTPWQWVSDWRVSQKERVLAPEYWECYEKEQAVIQDFAAGLTRVRRSLAHIPVYMIFDDHDITDDWNLTRAWEAAAYNHPFSRRIIGNAMVGYLLCQGWGNQPATIAPLLETAREHFSPQGVLDHNTLIDKLLGWELWHYNLPTTPKIVVLDTRTHRWRSESRPNRPSGLLDWESMTDMQQALLDEPRVILVSAAPVFGVKVIESIQRIFTMFGFALTVDAENWMAHPGSANVILNIFRHHRTPPEFIILSGDVHYSFVYDIALRTQKNSPEITQITASGIKNNFPSALLLFFDVMDRLLFRRYSPLNWFTKRRWMRIRRRYPDGKTLNSGNKAALLNQNGIGELRLTDEGGKVRAFIHSPNGESIEFLSREDGAA